MLVNIVKTFLLVITLLLSLIAASLIIGQVHAAEGWGLDQAYINYKQYTPGGTSYLITDNGLPDRAMDKEVALHLDTTFWSYLYFNNIIHAATDKGLDGSGQFRVVGWNFQLGARVASWLDVQYEHHSQHILDWQGPMHFPVEDSIGVNIYLYRTKTRESIF